LFDGTATVIIHRRLHRCHRQLLLGRLSVIVGLTVARLGTAVTRVILMTMNCISC